MKKILLFLLSFCMICTLSGCGPKKNEDDILAFFNAFDHTLEANSGQFKGSLTIKNKNDSKMNVDAQFNQTDKIQLAIRVGLEANGNQKDDYLDFYIKDGKTYLKNMDTKSQSVASNIGIKDNSKLSAYNPFLDFTDEGLVDLFTSSERKGNNYAYTIDTVALASALDSLGSVKLSDATLKATIRKNVIRHLELETKGTQTVDNESQNFEFTIRLDLDKYNSLSTVSFPDNLDTYPVSSTAK